MRLVPGFAECGATGGFFGGDAEVFAGAFANLFEVAGVWPEVVALLCEF